MRSRNSCVLHRGGNQNDKDGDKGSVTKLSSSYNSLVTVYFFFRPTEESSETFLTFQLIIINLIE